MTVTDDRLARLEDGLSALRERQVAHEVRGEERHGAVMKALEEITKRLDDHSNDPPPPKDTPPTAKRRHRWDPPTLLQASGWGMAGAAFIGPIVGAIVAGWGLGSTQVQDAAAEPPPLEAPSP